MHQCMMVLQVIPEILQQIGLHFSIKSISIPLPTFRHKMASVSSKHNTCISHAEKYVTKTLLKTKSHPVKTWILLCTVSLTLVQSSKNCGNFSSIYTTGTTSFSLRSQGIWEFFFTL